MAGVGPARRPRLIRCRPGGPATPAPWLRLFPPPPWRRPGSFIPRPARQTPALSFSCLPPLPPACRAPLLRPRQPFRSAGKRGARRGGRPERRLRARACPSALSPPPPQARPVTFRWPPVSGSPAAGCASGAAEPAASRAHPRRPPAHPWGGAAVTQAVCALIRRDALSGRGSECGPLRPAQLRPSGAKARWSSSPGPTEPPNSGSLRG